MASELLLDTQNGEENLLQSIRYSRGRLQLLDQRRLPLESVYIDIQDSTAGWHAIRDMVVRGAPAIAISAALSLAVEVANLGRFDGNVGDTLSFLQKRLDYLVSSRPTAVNLSDAAKKLQDVVLKAATYTNKAESVLQAIARFCGNVELCRHTEQVVFLEPYMESSNNHWTSPHLDEDAKLVREDGQLKLEIADLKSKRIVGVAHVEDFESIKDVNKRAECERRALNFAKMLMKQRRNIQTIEQVTEAI